MQYGVGYKKTLQFECLSGRFVKTEVHIESRNPIYDMFENLKKLCF